jgi:hypothetical protein
MEHVPPSFWLLREALRQLSLGPDEQRSELHGFDVTFELADGIDNAVRSLNYAQETAGILLKEDVVADLQTLDALFNDRRPDDSLWDPASLDGHPVWVNARLRARELIVRIPNTHQEPRG